MGSSNADESGLLTEAVFIESVKKECNDPKGKANVENAHRFFYAAMAISEDGYLQRDEFRRMFDNFGIDSSFTDQAFNAIDTNHAGKLSFDELIHAFQEFMFSQAEDSPYNLCWGPLI